MIHSLETLAVLAFAATPAAAQFPSVIVELHPGAVEHREVPVTVEVRIGRELPAGFALDATWSASVSSILIVPAADLTLDSLPIDFDFPAKVELPAQADLALDANGRPRSFIVRWMEPHLPANETVVRLVTVFPSAPSEVERFAFRVAQGQLDLTFGDQPVWRDMLAWDPERYEETYKPFQHLFAPDAPVLLTKGVGGTYSHHRGVFLGWGKTRAGGRTVNFWRMPPSESYQRLVGNDPAQRRAGAVAARSVSTVRWHTKEGEALVEDERDVTTWRIADGWLLDYRIELRSLAGDVELDGDPPHAGFQFRAAQSVAEANSCTYLRPESAVDQGNDNWAECAWVAGRFPIEGRRYEVAFFDHPDNPRPTVYNTRAYGRFGPFFRATLREGKPLVVRYRLLVRGLPEGADPGAEERTAEDLEREYASYAQPVVVRVMD